MKRYCKGNGVTLVCSELKTFVEICEIADTTLECWTVNMLTYCKNKIIGLSNRHLYSSATGCCGEREGGNPSTYL